MPGETLDHDKPGEVRYRGMTIARLSGWKIAMLPGGRGVITARAVSTNQVYIDCRPVDVILMRTPEEEWRWRDVDAQFTATEMKCKVSKPATKTVYASMENTRVRG
jgi:hypothetical protein